MMEVDEILSRLERFRGRFEREAVEAAVVRREQVIPGLLCIVEEAGDANRIAELDVDHDYIGPTYALFLLAQFRETRAYPHLLRIGRLPSNLLESLLGDFVTESFGRVLASICGGDTAGIQSLIEDSRVDEWVRTAAIHALKSLVVAGIRSREEIIEYFAALFRGRLRDKNEVVWSDLVCSSADLYAAGLLQDIKRAYAKGLIDTTIISEESVEADFAKGEELTLQQLAANSHLHLIDDTIKEMEWWHCFQPKKLRRDPVLERIEPLAMQPKRPPLFGELPRATAKAGRNEPCPCGSGKKYKKCCGSPLAV